MAAPSIDILIKATTQGFDKVINELKNLQNAFSSIGNSKIVQTVGNMNQQINVLSQNVASLTGQINKLSQAQATQNQGTSNSIGLFKNMSWSIQSIVTDMEKLMAIQVRWYGTRAILTLLVDIPTQAAKAMGTYAIAIDDARAAMERHLAITGKAGARGVAAGLVEEARKTSIFLPISAENLAKTQEAFIGANVNPATVKAMTADLGKLKSAFAEVDMNQFALAAVGAFNIFRDQLTKGKTEAEGFRTLLEQIMATASAGVIRPENFTKVIQYMGEIGNVTGFTTQQIFAYATALTNTSVPAANASRLLGGVMLSLTRASSVDAINQLGKQVGFTIDKAKNLGAQFEDIIALLAKLKEGGMDIEKIQWLQKLVPADRMKVLLGLMDRMKDIKSTKDVLDKTAGKALDLAADTKIATISGQWEMFKSTISEIGTVLGEVGSKMQTVMIFVVDIARGFLLGADSSGRFADKLNKLGTAGRVVYEVTKFLNDHFGLILGALAALLVSLPLVTGAFTSVGMSVLLASQHVARFLLILISGRWGLFAVQMADLGISFASLGSSIMKFVTGPAGIVLISIAAIYEMFKLLNYEMDKIEERDKSFNKGVLQLKNVAEVDAAIAKKRSEIAAKVVPPEKREEFASMTLEEQLASVSQSSTAASSTLNFEMAQLLARRAELLRPVPVAKKEKGLKLPPEEDKTLKSSLQSQLSSIAKAARDELAIAQGNASEFIRITHDKFRLGEISAEDYYDGVKRMAEGTLEDQKRTLTEWGDKANALYGQLYAIAKSDAQRKAINEAWIATFKDIEKLWESAHKTRVTEISKAGREEVEALFKIQTAISDAQRQQQEQRNAASEALEKGAIDRARAMLEHSLSAGLISYNSYYKQLEVYAKNDADTRLALVDENLKAERRKVQEQIAFLISDDKKSAQTKGLEFIKLNEQLKTLDEKAATDRIKIEEATTTKVKEIRIKASESMSALYTKEGASAVIQYKVRQFEASATDWGKQLEGAMDNVFSGWSSSFEELFTDSVKGQLKSLGDYITGFLTSVQNAIFKILSQQVAVSIMGLASSGFQALTAHSGGLIMHSGGLVPEFHGGGLNSDERIGILQTRERVLSRDQNEMFENMYSKLMANDEGRPVEVNLVNQSGTKLSSGGATVRFEPNKWVLSVILKDYQEDGPIRRLYGRG